jgi:hypothetical protein
LGDQMVGGRRRDDRLDVSFCPPKQDPSAAEQCLIADRQHQGVADGLLTPAGPAEPLEECGYGRRRVDLDDPVEVPDVDAQLKRRGRHDHAVATFAKGPLRGPPFAGPEGSVRNVGRDFPIPEGKSQLLGPGAAVDEDQTLLAAMQPRNDKGSVGQAAHVVKRDLRHSTPLDWRAEHSAGSPASPPRTPPETSNCRPGPQPTPVP